MAWRAAADAEPILRAIAEPSEYEHARDSVPGDERLPAGRLSGPQPGVTAVISETDRLNAGFALLYGTFSTCDLRV